MQLGPLALSRVCSLEAKEGLPESLIEGDIRIGEFYSANFDFVVNCCFVAPIKLSQKSWWLRVFYCYCFLRANHFPLPYRNPSFKKSRRSARYYYSWISDSFTRECLHHSARYDTAFTRTSTLKSEANWSAHDPTSLHVQISSIRHWSTAFITVNVTLQAPKAGEKILTLEKSIHPPLRCIACFCSSSVSSVCCWVAFWGMRTTGWRELAREVVDCWAWTVEDMMVGG